MSTFALTQLIQEAARVPGSHVCLSDGHGWGDEGGRACPKGWDHCSQPVFRCRSCGDYDHGDAGGPGHRHCYVQCKRPKVADDEPEPCSNAAPHEREEDDPD